MKKKIKEYLPVITIALIGVAILGIIGSGNIKKQGKEEKIIIYFPKIADFPNTEQGTVVFEFNFPSVSFSVGNKSADVLMFLQSEKIPGLYMGYNIKENRIKGGLPIIASEQITLIDGKPHKLSYVFNSQEGKQWIYLDGNVVAEGNFTGKQIGDAITGFAVRETFSDYKRVESPYSINVEFK